MTIDKDAVAAFMERKRTSFDWVKRLSRFDLIRELRESLDYWPFKGFKADLHQMACFVIGMVRTRFLFMLDMGAGKTWLVLLLWQYHRRKGVNVPQLLVLVPKKVHIGSW